MPSTESRQRSRSMKRSPVSYPKSPMLTPVITISLPPSAAARRACSARSAIRPLRLRPRARGIVITGTIAATVLHLQEKICAVASRARRINCLMSFSAVTFTVGSWSAYQRSTKSAISPLVVSHHDVNAFDVGHLLAVQLGIASRHHHHGIRVSARQFSDFLSAFLVSQFRHRASVDHANIGRLARLHRLCTTVGEKPLPMVEVSAS